MRNLNKKLEKMLLGNIFPFYAIKSPKKKKNKNHQNVPFFI